MGYIVRMPQMGMEMDQGEVVSWEYEEGDAVEADDVIVVVESEKATNEVNAREDGVIRRIIVEETEKVEPGTPIGILAGPEEDLAQYETQIDASLTESADDGDGERRSSSGQSAAATASATRSETTDRAADVRASPGAKRLAGEEGVDLTAVDGSGPGGAITEDDVEAHLENADDATDETTTSAASSDEPVRASPGARQRATAEGVSLAAVDGTGPGGAITERDVEAHVESGGETATGASRTIRETRELSTVQQTISDRLGESYREAVHVTLNRSFPTGTLREVKTAADRRDLDVSLTDLLLRAVGTQLEAQPEFNALFEDGQHKLVEEVNVGVAVDADGGLLTPVVPAVSEKSVEDVAAARRTLTRRALDGEASIDDLSGGTFTVSNLGMFGIDDFDPIINPPEIAILGVGRIRDDGTMTLSLSFDHRVVNGADAARFLDGLVDVLTAPDALCEYFDADVSPAPDLDDRELRIETTGELAGRVASAYGTVEFDEPEAVGGSGSAPSPVDHFLGALGSCLSLTVRQLASRDDVGVRSVSADVVGSPDRGPLETVDVRLRIETEADVETVNALVDEAERTCYVARVVSDEVPVRLDVDVESP
ncbi:2-oxo acid dehydrogenase subunit E2 [Natrarchaeobius oligotrophus]|uniref:2-oxo acid dehydrogenase subunit E2 n=1 Tax=Natrarchaeobius oligotrophus TaxID=3455743 RepID=UPI0014050DE7|nr:2-oxo acid dehydrogenase subunit E2 [Natrarchaeobius chitinivorans]